MTIDTGSRGLRAVPGEGTTQLVDSRCGTCAACRSARDYWCLDARDSGTVLAELADARDSGLVARWTSALAALTVVRRDPGSALLVLTDRDGASVAALVEPLHDGPVVVTHDPRDPEMRTRLVELSPTGRAPLVLTVTDVRKAVRAVERGGQVCGPDDRVRLPTVTELVQRDVTLVSARGIDALVVGSTWADLAARLNHVLSTPVADAAIR